MPNMNDDRQMNQVNRNSIDERVPDMPMLEAALAGLHRAEPDPARDALLAAFKVGHSAANFYDLLLKPNGPAPKNPFLERLIASGGLGVALPNHEMLKSNGSESDAMRKRHGGPAAPYGASGVYEMLVSPSSPAPANVLAKAWRGDQTGGDSFAAVLMKALAEELHNAADNMPKP